MTIDLFPGDNDQYDDVNFEQLSAEEAIKRMREARKRREESDSDEDEDDSSGGGEDVERSADKGEPEPSEKDFDDVE